MKIKFIKDHLDDKVNDVKDVAPARANYLISVNVAIEIKKIKTKIKK